MLVIDEGKRPNFKDLYDKLFRNDKNILKAKDDCKNMKNVIIFINT